MDAINGILSYLKNIENVQMIMLGGSRAIECYDELSDYDLYVYSTGKIDLNSRKDGLSKYLSVAKDNIED